MTETTWTPALEAELRYRVRKEYERQMRRQVSCGNKSQFSSPAEARAAKPKRTVRGVVTVYHCEFCRKWHLGSHVGRSLDGRPRNKDREVGYE